MTGLAAASGGRKKCALLACSTAALALGLPLPLVAQEAAEPAPSQENSSDRPASILDPELRQIVVIGHRAIVAALSDVEVEDTYDEDRVASYDVSTLGELLDQIRSENGDADPTLLVNGQPVRDLNDVSDLPVEAVQRIEQLPRGAAQRVGGASAQRAYNIVIKRSVKSATLTGSRTEATEGGWVQNRGEAILTYIQGQDRINLNVRRSTSSLLFEDGRNLTPRAEAFPYSVSGNVVPAPGRSDVDPVLTSLLGRPITVVALNGNPRPVLADLLAGADRTNESSLSKYRTLRGAIRPWEIGLSGNKQLADWLSLSVNGRLTWIDTESLRGLPSGRFLVPGSNIYTPFTSPVLIALNDRSRPLRSLGESSTQALSSTFNGNFGGWHATLLARYDRRKSNNTSETNGRVSGGFLTVPDATNPFEVALSTAIPVTSRTSISRTTSKLVSGDAEGPIFALPAGSLLVRAGAIASWTEFDAQDAFFGVRTFERRELTVKAGFTLPLTGTKFLPQFGESNLAVDIGSTDLGKYGHLDRYMVALNWTPVSWLRATASQSQEATAIIPEFLASPVTVTDNVPYFDPVRGETNDVQLMSGGTANLLNPRQVNKTLSLTATPLKKYNAQFSLDYQNISQRNLIGSLPFPSSAVVAAFPERFVRDASGRLVQVDISTVNFERQDTRQLRAGISFQLPITPTQTFPRTRTTPSRRIPGTNLQINLAHTVVLDSTTVIRAGLPEIDLLAGGATGIAGGEQRNYSNATVALTRGATGFRLNATYRGPTYLQTGTTDQPDRLKFGALWQIDLRVFADLEQLMPEDPMAKGTRISLVFDNLLNDRQRVINSAGAVPQAYQAVYRDPVGRTIMAEVRKVF